jgi:hypothetical protein
MLVRERPASLLEHIQTAAEAMMPEFTPAEERTTVFMPGAEYLKERWHTDFNILDEIAQRRRLPEGALRHAAVIVEPKTPELRGSAYIGSEDYRIQHDEKTINYPIIHFRVDPDMLPNVSGASRLARHEIAHLSQTIPLKERPYANPVIRRNAGRAGMGVSIAGLIIATIETLPIGVGLAEGRPIVSNILLALGGVGMVSAGLPFVADPFLPLHRFDRYEIGAERFARKHPDLNPITIA